MDVLTLEAQGRDTGTKAARAVRRHGNVPCVLYGHNVEPVVFQVPELALRPVIYTSETHRISIQIEGRSFDCIMKQAEFHPVTDRVSHVDFQVLQAGEKITLTIPVRFHGIPVGQIDQGGDTQYNVHDLEVRCLPVDIPGYIDVDVTHLSIGDAIHISDLDVPNVEFSDAPERTLVTVLPPRLAAGEPLEGEEAAAEAEIELGEGEEVDPGAGADEDAA